MPFDIESLILPVFFAGQIACILGMLAVGLGTAYATRRARLRAWEELARRTGLAFEPGGYFTTPTLTGSYRGHQITLDTFKRSSGRSSTTYTRIVVFVNNQESIYLALYEEGVFSKIGKFFGTEDVQVGDEEVDRRFIIKSRPETFAARVFTSINLRGQLLKARHVNIEIDGREIYLEERGDLTDADYIQFLFDLLSELADFVERG
jgi:hypothetical protein